ncbi:hypothetical protein DDE74_08920 [Streptomyces lydicus]|uniref:Uncharacterized protein n=1 Tax=Streptomyces lydicus TaxID=47763 RepID=A0A3Q9K853_9ACTN|nr:hypothetical protein DDE74_08920 [Streptomyces lydicus]
MPSDTLDARTASPAAPPDDGTPHPVPRIVPRRRTGQWAAAAAVLALLALAIGSVVRNDAFHRTYQVILLLLVATLWYIVVTSALGVGQYYLERHYARGTAGAR